MGAGVDAAHPGEELFEAILVVPGGPDDDGVKGGPVGAGVIPSDALRPHAASTQRILVDWVGSPGNGGSAFSFEYSTGAGQWNAAQFTDTTDGLNVTAGLEYWRFTQNSPPAADLGAVTRRSSCVAVSDVRPAGEDGQVHAGAEVFTGR